MASVVDVEELLAELEQLRAENVKLKEQEAEYGIHRRVTQFGLVQVSPDDEKKAEEEGPQMEHEKTNKWYREAGGLWPPPRILRDTDTNDKNYDHERDMTWSELFFDLIFVVAIARLGEQLRDESAVDVDVVGFTVYFLQFWTIWQNCAFYGNQFGTNDLPNMLFFSTVMGCVCFMTTHLTGGEAGPNVWGFCISALAASAAMLTMNIRVWRGVTSPRGWGSCRMLTWRICVPGIFYLLAAIFGGNSPAFCWRMLVMAVLADVGIMKSGIMFFGQWFFLHCLVGGRRNEKGDFVPNGFVPFHLEHINERVGLLVIIFLGDNVDNVTDAYSPTATFFFAVFASFVVIVCLKNLYFDVDDQDIDFHAIRRSPLTTQSWWILVCTLCYGIALFGNGLSLVLEHVAGKPQSLEARRQPIMCLGLCVVLFSMTGVALSHRREWHSRKQGDGSTRTTAMLVRDDKRLGVLRCLFIAQQVAHFGFACLVALLPLAGLPDLALMSLLAGIGVVLVILNLVDEVVELSCKREEASPPRTSILSTRRSRKSSSGLEEPLLSSAA